MHLSVKHSQSIIDGDVPVNPEQTPAELLMLSFTDSDLACMAAANAHAEGLRLTSLAPLKHPLSVDLYIEQVAQHAKVIVVRLLGGYEWWGYGVQELGRIAQEKNIALAIVPGCSPDPRLSEISTMPAEIVAAINKCLAQGGVENAKQVLTCMQDVLVGKVTLPTPLFIESGALYKSTSPATGHQRLATILFYRAHTLAADTAPIDALLAALTERGINARAFMVTSLKDTQALAALHKEIKNNPPDILIDATAFSAGSDAHPLAFVDVPILQIALANCTRNAWHEAQRGLATADLAMHVVLPEADGRVFTRAISFKGEIKKDAATEFTLMAHTPEQSRVSYVAELASKWVELSKKLPSERRIALIVSDYPDRPGRSAYAVGLDGPQSAVSILRLLKHNHYHVIDIPSSGTALLDAFSHTEPYALAAYKTRLAALPFENQSALEAAWGAPEADPFFAKGAFHLPCFSAGNITLALQPDRGAQGDRKSGYHDATTPPRHGYLAFYWWLQDVAQMHAMIHLGTHGNLEWLPGKSVALSTNCWPEIALGATPVIYPYIVSDPGEAAQAKRRISAVTLSHLTPPLMPVCLSPELTELETLVDEYSAAEGLDGRRMKMLSDEILHRAKRAGLASEGDTAQVLAALETHLCDIKEQRVGNGLHIFGEAPATQNLQTMAETLHEISNISVETIGQRLHGSAASEQGNLLAALNGQFIMPAPGGSPVRGRLDILPTGRNMVTLDPRMIPTPTAAIIGKRSAQEFVRRYTQDHGDFPKQVVIDVWGSASLRNGGDELAQALYLMGVCPLWDKSSGRVSGFEIIPDTEIIWPRIDVALRISGLFRDMFANLITLFDDAARAVARLHGWQEHFRIFGSAPGAYGSGVIGLIDSGNWSHKSELGQAYLNASHFVYGRNMDGEAQPALLKARVANADALIHVQDQREMDVLSGADFADAEGGFAAAASLLGNEPALYHLDTSRPNTIKARSLAEEISLTLHARAINPEWIAGQMRHGYAGAAGVADAVDQLFSFAATTNAVACAQFDAAFDAYLYDDKMRDFIARENPAALQAIAARFDEAIARGLWNPLRNSVRTLLENILGDKGIVA